MSLIKKYSKASDADFLTNFYEMGSRIRTRNNEGPVDWIENRNISDFVLDEALDIMLFTSQSENDEGRIVAYYNKEDKIEGFLGWYECDQDIAINESLFKDSVAWLKEKGCKSIIGPINGTTWSDYRLNKTSPKPLFPGEPFQPLYYFEYWKKAGFEPNTIYRSEIPPRNIFKPTNLDEVSKLLFSNGINLRQFPSQPEKVLLDKLYDFYNICFETNPLFHPISREKYYAISDKMGQIIDTQHSFLLEDQNKKPIAVFISYKDVYHELYGKNNSDIEDYKKNKLIIKTIATHPDWQNKQIGTLMINLIHNLAYQNGYDEVIHALMYTENISSKRGREKFQTKIIREYCLMQKRV